ncbi:MAG TPA: nucleoside 2-deoxyribosyltransferase [Gaiellaceae bacterium]|nr:nucleoside 2-deoxyribosyltransferase [Gaiellaceae bacterium]
MLVYFAGPLFTPYERGFIDECAARLRAEGFDVFVPHEKVLATEGLGSDEIFRLDGEAVAAADVLVALLDGPSIDDGTACEIGLFHGLARSDPRKRGVIGLATDFRGGLNLFVRGCIEADGELCGSLDEVVAALKRRAGQA